MATRDRTAWLQGGNARCRQAPPDVGRTWRLVLLGPPGAGKGTQANLLCRALGACPLSTDDVFRAAREQTGTPGSGFATIRSYMARGDVVPDPVVVDLIRERGFCLRCRGGFMLDGFPRTLPQARVLDALLTAEKLRLDAVINFEVSQAILLQRLAGRRVCPRCQGVFHVDSKQPRIDGICDYCDTVLVQRADDRPEAVDVQLEAYAKATCPLIEYYRSLGLLISICAEGEPADVLGRTLDSLVDRAAVS